MFRSWISCILAFLLSFMMSACTTATTQPQVQTSAIFTAKRVVTLSSLATDIIYQLDSTKLVGITGSTLFKNDSRFQNLPRVSEGQTPPNLEKIVALKPDLVIGAAGFSNQVTQRLEQLGIRTLLTQVNNWQSLAEVTKEIAKLIDVNPQPLLERYQSFLPDKVERSPSTLVLVSIQPILSPNKNSWAGDLLDKFQLKNLAAELQGKSPVAGYVTLSAEKVLEANPETILIVSSPGSSPNSVLEALQKESFWQKLQATKNNRVYVFDYYGLVNPGSIDAIEKACRQLQQNLFKS
ncbi:iron ABC transporter substrate-binding protein [Nostoc sp. CENA543]|uniref:ABC transporter substrate-binding protein n=1 Tax=Nostoc sp. CENA543 TaxID=1869241 RepID=UPI000CA304BB|nr:ABC transporter substrate-binding protein [Nostoc sp. CENA543]AUS99623.1 iron ABC transporter substrate-binding protein [Nostoc sp. CENA543]